MCGGVESKWRSVSAKAPQSAACSGDGSRPTGTESRWRFQRKRYGKCASLTNLARHGNVAAKESCESAGHAQSKTGASDPPRAGLLDLPERIENLVAVL